MSSSSEVMSTKGMQQYETSQPTNEDIVNNLLVMLVKEPEDIGIKLLLNDQYNNTKSHDNDEDDMNDNTSAANQQQHRQLTWILRKTGKELFQQIESLYQQYNIVMQQQVHGKKKKKNNQTAAGVANIPPTTTLSGLPQLYISTNTTNDDTMVSQNINDITGDDDFMMDAETIWGQVELQNNALQKVIKRSLRQLLHVESMIGSNSSITDIIRLLHNDENDDDDDDDDDDDKGEHDEESNDQVDDVVDNQLNDDDDDDDSSEEEENLDEETKRIRDRMKRTMEEMSDDDENDDDDDDDDEDDVRQRKSLQRKKVLQGSKLTTTSVVSNDEEIENDPVALNLHDGFFNLQEMEEFADEEEEYLPDDAYGPISTDVAKKNKKDLDQRSFHQKQRDGDFVNDPADNSDSDDDDNDDDEDEDAELFGGKKDPLLQQRRKKYRDDEDIEALYKLYEAPRTDIFSKANNDNDDANDAIHMTAADIFGQPNRKYYTRYKQQGNKSSGDDTDDNIDQEYEDDNDDFRSNDKKKHTGWNDDDENDENSDGDDVDDDDDDGDGDVDGDGDDNQDTDELVPMKNVKKSKQPKPKIVGSSQSIKLLQQTEQLEREMLAEKPWQMMGETGSMVRPVNSLLDSTPEFEVATKVIPIITVAHTANLEEIIKQRILAEDWDDVLPRELPDVGWHKKRGELPEVSQEKSKLGLGELYEREYLKKVVGYDKDAVEKLSTEDQLKNEMKSLFANVCSKLDALSNYHFTPRPVAPETEVRPITVPAIAMEEVLPIHVSDARGVAPEEVYGSKKRGRETILRDVSELDQQDKKRIRNSKKTARRKERRAKLADEKLISRLEPNLGLNNPYEKRKMREELSMARAGGRITTGEVDMNDKYGTSQTFFQRLQNEAKQTVRNDNNGDDTVGNNGTIVSSGRKMNKAKSAKSSAYKL